MKKEIVIERLKGLIEYCESIKGEHELDKNEEAVAVYELDIIALKEAISMYEAFKDCTGGKESQCGMAYLVIMRDKGKAINKCEQYEDGSDLLDALEWLPENNELNAVIYFGRFLAVSSWEELRKFVSG